MQSASALHGLRLVDITRDSIFIGGVGHNGYRRLFQAVGSRGNALQVDEDAESGGLATEKSSITGTGDVEGASTNITTISPDDLLEDETSTNFSIVDEEETRIQGQGSSSTGGEKEDAKQALDEGAIVHSTSFVVKDVRCP